MLKHYEQKNGDIITVTNNLYELFVNWHDIGNMVECDIEQIQNIICQSLEFYHNLKTLIENKFCYDNYILINCDDMYLFIEIQPTNFKIWDLVIMDDFSIYKTNIETIEKNEILLHNTLYCNYGFDEYVENEIYNNMINDFNIMNGGYNMKINFIERVFDDITNMENDVLKIYNDNLINIMQNVNYTGYYLYDDMQSCLKFYFDLLYEIKTIIDIIIDEMNFKQCNYGYSINDNENDVCYLHIYKYENNYFKFLKSYEIIDYTEPII